MNEEKDMLAKVGRYVERMVEIGINAWCLASPFRPSHPPPSEIDAIRANVIEALNKYVSLYGMEAAMRMIDQELAMCSENWPKHSKDGIAWREDI